ncbi:hypothetical protein QJQ45_028124, partial [Haematococcus lacustris]
VSGKKRRPSGAGHQPAAAVSGPAEGAGAAGVGVQQAVETLDQQACGAGQESRVGKKAKRSKAQQVPPALNAGGAPGVSQAVQHTQRAPNTGAASQKRGKAAAGASQGGGSVADGVESGVGAVDGVVAGTGTGAGAGSGLLDKMRARLAGGRFRSLNEALYTCDGQQALEMMQADPSLFSQYHQGFASQTAGWPQQPLALAARWLAARPEGLVVADFGCGEGQLATRVKQRVHSFDLVSAAPHVVACNMAAVPLPDASVDVAVFSLALMGTDYAQFLMEASRVLRHKGWLWIAEVRSRFAADEQHGADEEAAPSRPAPAGKQRKDGGSQVPQAEDLKPFLRCLARLGYALQSLDTSNTMFFVAVLRKLHTAAPGAESMAALGKASSAPWSCAAGRTWRALPPVGKEYQQGYKLVNDRSLKEMAELSMKRHGCAKELVVFFGAAVIGTAGGWGADAVLRACCKVVCRPRGTCQHRGRVVLVDEHRTSRVSSAVNGQQPCEAELDKLSATRPAGWKPPEGQVEPRLVRPAWSQERGQPVRGLMWCPVVAYRKPPQAPRSSQSATQPAASEPGPSTPPPAKRSKPAAEPTKKGKGKGKAAKAKPAPQPGRWLDRDCNAALNMQRIAESRWRPLELCYWPDQGALPAKGKEYPEHGYKRLRDKPPKAQQQQPAEAQ